MATGSKESASLEALSALADGELDDIATAQACAWWRSDPAARSSWHTYQLIGDVLRSDDLASNAAHDEAFLERLRARLGAEPIVLTPSRSSAPIVVARAPVAALRSRRWAASAAAASFVIVAGGIVLMRSVDAPSLAPADTALAQAEPAAAPQIVAAQDIAAAPAEPDDQTPAAGRAVIRDARLDRYLAAHKQFAGSSALGLPSAFLRSATADGSGR